MRTLLVSNFAHLQEHDPQLLRLGMLAEKYFPDDPNTSLLKLRQLTELLAQLTASKAGLFTSPEEAQYDLIRRLQDHRVLPREVGQLFDEIRRTGNAANHGLHGDHRTALASLKVCWQIGLWYHRTFKNPEYKSGPFIPPKPPADESAELREELRALSEELAQHRTSTLEATERLEAVEAQLRAAKDEQAFWEQMAAEVEREKTALAEKVSAQQTQASAHAREALAQVQTAADTAAGKIYLDEADTRRLIDRQLRQAGWEADTELLRHGKGTRPEKGRNLAIAEWPTESGPADYVFFVGLTPIATVEAKRKNIDVSGALKQAKRYSRDFRLTGGELELPAGPFGEYKIPFAFSANGRPYVRQLETRSGIWFCDLRHPENLAHALDGWYTPEGLQALLKRDAVKAHAQLRKEGFDYGFPVRPYQQTAILAVENAIAQGKRELLLAMATGTGKTKTCVALIYRLLKANRFRRILFLVDRSALGEQAANAFKDTRMENLQTFADTFGIKEIDVSEPETATSVHLATVQGMVHRVLNAGAEQTPPSVDQYDCIIVDECHRGYLLDRELSETEQSFRGFDDYISKYRRVLDYFDAVKIGLTATPAQHTVDIFGFPVYRYGYREAVIDGYLIDHEPPLQIKTELSTGGIQWKVGEEIKLYNPRQNAIDLTTAPDDITLEVEDFNRKVITEPFNRVVCEALASEIDPSGARKTLIFCVNDAHADLVVELLKKAFQQRYGSVEDDAVVKITGNADKPLELIRRYKNEGLPKVAVTVDLLTTGIDVPEICNLVFIRRVNSRILYDQMVGRATRLCDKIGKETFRIFDAVQIYDTLQTMTEMQPVVVNPKIDFKQLVSEMTRLKADDERQLVRDQILAKLQRKKRHLSEKSARDFETVAGMAPEVFIDRLRAMPLAEVANWFLQHPGLGEILDRKNEGQAPPLFISDHPDRLIAIERGYGTATKPQDYIEEFSAYVRKNANTLPALKVVLTRPRDLTRKQLRELLLNLDTAGFSETNLTTAWREMTNQEIAARIIGYIRQAAIGDPLVPYAERVDRALQTILAQKNWTTPQRDWLKKIAGQTKANLVVDRDALDDPDLVFRRDGGGFTRLDKVFEGELAAVLDAFHAALWA